MVKEFSGDIDHITPAIHAAMARIRLVPSTGPHGMTTHAVLTELEPEALASALAALDAPAFHARQIYQWIYRRGVTDFARMTDLSGDLRARLDDTFTIPTPDVVARHDSTDGTVKFQLRFDDGREVETVFIPDTPAMTFCVSTQVGCAMQCGFCLTGRMGLLRNLTAGEIAAQVRLMAHALDLAGRRFNIVLMGMGEPLHNYDATMKALRILAADCGLAVHPRRVTLSTVGVLPALERRSRCTRRRKRSATVSCRSTGLMAWPISSPPAAAFRRSGGIGSLSSTSCCKASTTASPTPGGWAGCCMESDRK